MDERRRPWLAMTVAMICGSTTCLSVLASRDSITLSRGSPSDYRLPTIPARTAPRCSPNHGQSEAAMHFKHSGLRFCSSITIVDRFMICPGQW